MLFFYLIYAIIIWQIKIDIFYQWNFNLTVQDESINLQQKKTKVMRYKNY